MKIDPDDPCTNMSIRLELAARMAQSLLWGSSYEPLTLADDALKYADAMIERANREEGKKPR